MTEFLSFPEALYMVNFGHEDINGGLAHLAVDARKFTDVEDFIFTYKPAGWEILDIEKTYAYAKMYAGDNGERIDFTIVNLNHMITHEVDTLDVDTETSSWEEIIASACRRSLDSLMFSKRTPRVK